MYRILPPKLYWRELVGSVLSSSRKCKSNSPVEQLSRAWSTKLENAPCIPFGSGRAALAAALRLGVRAPGRKVAVPSFVCSSVVAAIQSASMEPLFVDISSDLTLSPESLEQQLDKHVAAIVMPHIYGKICNYPLIKSIAASRGCILIDDAAACAGLTHNGETLGLLGDYGIVSMNYKTVSSLFGGMLVIPNERSAVEFRSRLAVEREYSMPDDAKIYNIISFIASGLLANSGAYRWIKKLGLKGDRPMEPIDQAVSINGISDWAAVIGLTQMKHFDAMQKCRKRNSEILKRELDGIEQLEVMVAKNKDFFTRFVICFSTDAGSSIGPDQLFQNLKQFLWDRKVQVFSAYTPAHLLLHSSEHLPVTEKIFSNLFLIPNNPVYEENDMVRIAEHLRAFFRSGSHPN